MDALTVDEFKQALPTHLKKTFNPVLIQEINQKLADPEMYEVFRENLLGYTQVMQQGRFRLSNYIDAVKYISYKIASKSNLDAFTLTFPDKIKHWHATGVVSKDIASYTTAYNKSKLVKLLYEQTFTPSWVMNQDLYQKAINTQAELMMTANSEKVRTDAANSLLTHLKPPETHKIELDIGVKPDSTIEALRRSTEALVIQQRKAIQSGMTNAQEIGHSHLVLEIPDVEEAELVDQDD